MKLVMFDVDGTLTETVQADEECFVQSLREVFGFTYFVTAWPSYPYFRYAITQASIARAAEFYSRTAFDVVVYVRDGLWDARASSNLGFSFVGISRDPAKVERLYAEGAVRVFLNYLDKNAILNVLTSV